MTVSMDMCMTGVSWFRHFWEIRYFSGDFLSEDFSLKRFERSIDSLEISIYGMVNVDGRCFLSVDRSEK